MSAAATGFMAWLDNRGGFRQSSEEMLAIRAVRRFIEFHGESRFTPLDEWAKKVEGSQASYQPDTVPAGEPDPAGTEKKKLTVLRLTVSGIASRCLRILLSTGYWRIRGVRSASRPTRASLRKAWPSLVICGKTAITIGVIAPSRCRPNSGLRDRQ